MIKISMKIQMTKKYVTKRIEKKLKYIHDNYPDQAFIKFT